VEHSTSITFKCVKCDQTLAIDESNPPNDSDIFACTCGHQFGTYAEVKEAMIELGKKSLDKMIDDAGLPPWITRK
jgi:hypothetical protein